MKQNFFAFFMMQMNLTSFNIPLEVCKHISSTCLVGSLKLCRSTQIWDLMNSSHYNKNWKKIYIMHTSITSAHTVHFFLIENLQASTKSIIFKLIQYSTLLTEEIYCSIFISIFILLKMHLSANTNSFWNMHKQKQINDYVW